MTLPGLPNLAMRAALRTFGELAGLPNGRAIKGIFDSRQVLADVEGGAPVSVRTTSFAYDPAYAECEPVAGDILTVRGERYRVRDRQPDSLGQVVLELERIG